MIRHLIYYITLIFIIISANTGFLELLLNSVVGVKWSSPIVNFITQNTQGLIIILLISIYFDHIKGEYGTYKQINSKVDIVIESLDKNLKLFNLNISKRKDKKDLISKLLSDSYKEEKNISHLTSTILSDKPYYTNVNINYSLENMSNPIFYKLIYQLQFVSSIDFFIICFVCSADLQDKISASSDTINDVFTFSDSKFMKENLENILIKKTSLLVVSELDDGKNQCIPCPFKTVPKSDYQKYIDKSLSNKFDDIRLIKAITGFAKNQRFILEHEFMMHTNDHYCYWVADRPMFTEKIVFDASKFEFSKNTKFVFQPFMANTTGDNVLINNNIFTINVHNWLVKGQGAILTWR